MSIRKDNKGNYIVDVSGGFNPITKKRIKIIRKGILSYKEAQSIENELRYKIIKNKIITKKNVNISMLWDLYIEEIEEHHKLSYINSQRYNYNAHIKTYFSDTNIQKITKNEIKEFRDYLKAFKLSNNSINKIIILLKKIFDIGLEKNLLEINPAKGLKKLTVEKKKMEFWTIEEFKTFISLLKVDEYSYKVFFLTLYFTGMRLGEILALTWNDLNFITSEISISKTFSTNKGKALITTPKTKYSNRQISINQALLNELKNWQTEQEKLLSSYLLKQTSETLIFQFKPMLTNKDTIYKFFQKVLKRDMNLKKIRLHDFRHSHVALLIDNKEDYTVIKERLGHSSITTTIDIYGHLFPNKQKSTADKLDKFF